MLVLDADTSVVNPNHCIEEYIDPRVDIVFYERFFNWEIASGNYLVRNTQFAKDFLLRWANYGRNAIDYLWWSGSDNGALHMVFLETILPSDSQEVKNCRNLWLKARAYDTYVPFVVCVRFYLGATRIWPQRLKLLRRAHGFCRDWYNTGGLWTERDFLIHGWKSQTVRDNDWASPFYKDIELSRCGNNYDGWPWKPDKKVKIEEIRHLIELAENRSARTFPKNHLVIPFLDQPDIAQCYPNCDINERFSSN
ncbi:unnamed protein product [Enterobius vermicularis]|uniref:Glycosyltransferase n=1 Tax=Enterobius vermicularis TaxID=51028 RepID=A0A0N4VKC8_ENTVE|nr:unnamed protein product [Enterobius vermicularis]